MKMTLIKLIIATFIIFIFPTKIKSQSNLTDKDIPHYHKISGIAGSVISVGSDTMTNLMVLWLESFRNYYPLVSIQIEGKGSVTAPPALIEGTAQLGPMSRPMSRKEVRAFNSKYGVSPLFIKTAFDALAVYVHRENPLDCVTLEQLDAIFSKTRNRGYPENITLWGQLGLAGDWVSTPISIYGRNTASGTHGVFKLEDLKRGDFKDEVKEQPGSASVVQSITSDKAGIGYSGIGYNTSGVRVLKLSEQGQDSCVEANYENILSNEYPFVRNLYIYTIQLPDEKLDPLIKEFFKFILSYEGQVIVEQEGFFPLTLSIVMQERNKLEEL